MSIIFRIKLHSRATTFSNKSDQTHMAKLLADMIGNALHHAVSLLELTNKILQGQNVSFANFIDKKYMGIPANMDLAKGK